MLLKDLIPSLNKNTKIKIYSKKYGTTVFTGEVEDFQHFLTQDMMHPYMDSIVEHCTITDSVLVINCN